MGLSVVIPTRGAAIFLADTVASVLAEQPAEVIVVDNNQADDVRLHELIGSDARVALVREPKPGLHNARHSGARVARSEFVAFLDDDVVVEPGWLRSILGPFSDPAVACVGGPVRPRWEAQPPIWLQDFPAYYLSLLDLGDAERDFGPEEAAHGCNLAVRRSALFRCGGFNPDAMGRPGLLWLRGDGEIGLQLKLRTSARRIVYAAGAVVLHRIPAGRLTVAYFAHRALLEGISASYSQIRRDPSRYRLARHAAGCSLRAARAALRLAARGPKRRLVARVECAYWYGRGMHQLRVLLSPALRNHVLKDNYFN